MRQELVQSDGLDQPVTKSNNVWCFLSSTWSIALRVSKSWCTIRKTNKSVLGREILKNISLVKSAPAGSAYIVDAMAMVHRLPINLKTFGNAADSLLRMILRDSASTQYIELMSCSMSTEILLWRVEKENVVVYRQPHGTVIYKQVTRYSNGKSFCQHRTTSNSSSISLVRNGNCHNIAAS